MKNIFSPKDLEALLSLRVDIEKTVLHKAYYLHKNLNFKSSKFKIYLS